MPKHKKQGPLWVPLDTDTLSPPAEEMNDIISSMVVGQVDPRNRISRSAEVISANIIDPNKLRPRGVFLFLGPTGVGKTLMARAMGQWYVGDRSAIVKHNCSEFSSPHMIAKLIGSPAGYVGMNDEPGMSQFEIDLPGFRHRLYYRDLRETLEQSASLLARNLLIKGFELKDDPVNDRLFFSRQGYNPHTGQEVTEKITTQQFIGRVIEHLYDLDIGAPYRSVVLLDELEKAHSMFLNLLLQIVEDAELGMSNSAEGQGPRITLFDNSIIVMTSNLGSDAIRAQVQGTAGFRNENRSEDGRLDRDKIYQLVRGEAEQSRIFRAELWSRIERRDGFIVFEMLSKDEMRQVFDLETARLEASLAHSGIPLDVTYAPDVKEHVVEKRDQRYGARDMGKLVDKYFEVAIANALNKGLLAPGCSIQFVLRQKEDESGEMQDVIVLEREGEEIPDVKRTVTPRVGQHEGVHRDIRKIIRLQLRKLMEEAAAKRATKQKALPAKPETSEEKT